MSDDDLLTPAEVAARCKVSVKTVLRAIRAGALRASRLGGRYAYRMRAEDVDAWLDHTTIPAAAPRAPAPIDASPHRSTTRGNRLMLTREMGRRE